MDDIPMWQSGCEFGTELEQAFRIYRVRELEMFADLRSVLISCAGASLQVGWIWGSHSVLRRVSLDHEQYEVPRWEEQDG